jgi:hypothetical protein
LIGDTGEGNMQRWIPSFKIELYTAAGVFGDSQHLIEQVRINGTIGLPADPQNPSGCFFAGLP